MARLTDMVESDLDTDLDTDIQEAKDALVEALETLIEMVENDVLDTDELETLDETIEFISEDFDLEDEELNERRMSPKAKMAARKYRLKNKAKLKRIAKLKKRCMVKIAGKTDKLTCNSKGQVKRIDKARSRAAKRGAKSR